MRLTEALSIVQNSSPGTRSHPLILACGFTPLHLQTFLTAHLQQLLPQRRVQASTGLLGDLAGALEGIRDPAIQGVAVALEWAIRGPDGEVWPDAVLGHRRLSIFDLSAVGRRIER